MSAKRKPIPPLVRFFSKPGSWSAGAFRKGRARCLLAALWHYYPYLKSEREKALAALRAVLPGLDLIIWNDAPGRTRKQVLAACKRAGV